MKRLRLWAIALGMCLTTGSLTTAQGQAEKRNDGTPRCTVATLKGRYLFGGVSTRLSPAGGQQSLLAVAGQHIFDGHGTGTDTVTVSIDGVTVLENFETPITYAVNANCTGTFTIPVSGESFGMFIAPTGEELIAIGTDPGAVVVLGPSRRVSGK
jgi:hypothetical protein